MIKRTFIGFLLLCGCISAMAEKITVNGTVTGNKDEAPLVGSYVYETDSKGNRTDNNAVTDVYGNYSITVGTGNKLVYNHIGYKTKTIKIITAETEKDTMVINVYLKAKTLRN